MSQKTETHQGDQEMKNERDQQRDPREETLEQITRGLPSLFAQMVSEKPETQGRQILAEIDAGGRLRFTIDVNPLRLYCAISPATGGDTRLLFEVQDDNKRFIV